MNLQTLSITDACAATGLPRSAMYRLLESGAVAGNRVGNRWRVSAVSLSEWVNQKPEPAAPRSETRAFPEVEDRFA